MIVLLALYPVVRGVIFAGLLLLVGVGIGERLVGLVDDERLCVSGVRRLRIILPPLVIALLLAVLIRGVLQVVTFMDPGDPISWPLIDGAILTGGWGHAWMAQIGALMILAILSRQHRPITRWTVVVLTLIVLLAQSTMGHPAAKPWPGPLGLLLDTLHLIGGGIWLGTLAILAVAVLPLLSASEALPIRARLIERYSFFARLGVILIIGSGVIETLVYARSPALFIHSRWGQLLVLKLLAMSGVMALGWYNWKVVTPALVRIDPTAGGRLQRAIRIELSIGVVLLAITALLVATALPGEG